MTRQSRTLLVLLGFGTASVVVLGMMAGRYNKILEQQGSLAPDPAALHKQVDRFIRVRTKLLLAIDPEGDGPPVEADPKRVPELLRIRDQAMATAGIAASEYLEVLEAFDAWRQGRPEQDERFRPSLERRRADLARIDLGPYEPL